MDFKSGFWNSSIESLRHAGSKLDLTHLPQQLVKPLFSEKSSITLAGRQSEEEVLRSLHARFNVNPSIRISILEDALELVRASRQQAHQRTFLDQFLAQYGLSSSAGVALMCICEALLRIPDDETVDALLAERLSTADWSEHLGRSDSIFLNASTWALLLTGRVFALQPDVTKNVIDWLAKLVVAMGEPAIRAAMAHAVQVLSNEFVFDQTIEGAVVRAHKAGIACSFDMLGEGARTTAEAEKYFEAYVDAIDAIAASNAEGEESPSGISIKLSALHPRYEPLQRDKVRSELGEKLRILAARAAAGRLQISIDAEEAVRLELSLELFEQLVRAKDLADWHGLGFVVQAYSKRSFAVIEWLDSLASIANRRIPVRLVKGAYWDAEIKSAQVQGLSGYPVFTQKASTDFAWLVALQRLFGSKHLFPQVATHNAYAIAAALKLSAGRSFEFQRLHGMGELLYDQAAKLYPDLPLVRVYAPVGPFKNLLSYLVRRLLENGANASFVNRFLNDRLPITEVVKDPVVAVEESSFHGHPKIPLPLNIYGADRQNSRGIDFGDWAQIATLLAEVQAARVDLRKPDDSVQLDVNQAFRRTAEAHNRWSDKNPRERRELFDRCAGLLEARQAQLIRLLRYEAGKCLVDAVAEVREAVDFCRYYGMEAERMFVPKSLTGPTGETNTLTLRGRGVFACIAPWNFPLAIFLGQIVAALAAGNTVVAKPAVQTPAIGRYAIELLIEAGIPQDCVQVVYGGSAVGSQLIEAKELAGVAFTGSLQTAKTIQKGLAERKGAILPLIAETGGVNAMIVDSSVLVEQTVDDILTSAFRSAGQRCSALRLLCVQEDVADNLLAMLKGAMALLNVGDPADPATDVGPVIDTDAFERLAAYISGFPAERILYQLQLDAQYAKTHIAPTLLEVDAPQDVEEEVFGPILHVSIYSTTEWLETLVAIRNSGFGLTFGVQTRIRQRAEQAVAIVGAGNAYINRDMIGATVGVQPFGGHGLSGTGPKAGGPNYLLQFANERVVTDNVVATGGNTELLQLED